MVMKLSKVTWYDTITIAGWRTQESLLDWKFETMTSYGLLLRNDKDVIILVGLVDTEENCNSIQIIPFGCIVKIEEV